jgi:hypothetical protein
VGDVRCDVHISKGSKTFRCSSAHLNVPSGSARFTHPSAESSQHGEAVVYILNVCVRPLPPLLRRQMFNPWTKEEPTTVSGCFRVQERSIHATSSKYGSVHPSNYKKRDKPSKDKALAGEAGDKIGCLSH